MLHADGPAGLAGGLNLYQYAPNPLSWINPLGLTSCQLSKAMEKNGTPRPKNSAAHHIVPETAKGAKPARDILKKHKIDINGADNGFFCRIDIIQMACQEYYIMVSTLMIIYRR